MNKWDTRDKKVNGRRKTSKSRSYLDRQKRKRVEKRIDKETRAGIAPKTNTFYRLDDLDD